MDFNDYYEVAAGILKGDFDEYLDGLAQTIAQRKKDKAPKVWEYKVGDRIKMVNTNPKYLNGATGRIVKINRTKVVVDLDMRHGRFYTNIATPLSMVEKV